MAFYLGEVNRRGTHLVYLRPWRGLDVEIFVQELRGGAVNVMPLNGRFARWSRGGESLLVVSSAEGTWDLWTLGVEAVTGVPSGDPKRLTTALSLGKFTLDPQGSRVIATRTTGNMDVWDIPTDTGPLVDGSHGRRLTNDAFDHSHAKWLPEGDGFLEVSDRRGSEDLWRVNLSDGGRLRLMDGSIVAGVPSADGRWIICTIIEDGGRAFPYIMRSDGSQFHELEPSLRDEFMFAFVTDWSKVGNRLAVHSKIENAWRVAVLTWDDDEEAVSDYSILPFSASIPFWSPDGCNLVVQRTVDGQRDLYVTNIDGSVVTRLTNDTKVEWVCGWESEPSRIYYKDGEDDTVYRISMDSEGKPISEPEVWIRGSEKWQVRQFLDFRNGHAIGPVNETDSDLWLLELVAHRE